MTIVGKDYKQQILCKPCWNGSHYTYDRNSNCDQGDCECWCRAMLLEKTPRKKPIETMEIPMDGIIEEIGPRS